MHWLTCVELTEVPQSSSTMAATLRVETPCTYISAKASLRACSLRTPFSSEEGVELQAGTDLGDLEGDGPDPGGEGLGLEAVGLSLACGSALIGLGLEDDGAFAAHGFIDEEADALAEALVALLSEELQDGVQEIRVGLVRHVFLGGGCV